jgi:hypothetical protein
MDLLMITLGIETIILLAVLIGVASGRQARDAAWRRIADARRTDQETICRNCPLRKFL